MFGAELLTRCKVTGTSPRSSFRIQQEGVSWARDLYPGRAALPTKLGAGRKKLHPFYSDCVVIGNFKDAL